MKILLFGITKDIIGSSVLDVTNFTTNTQKTVGDLHTYLQEKYPDLKKLSSLAIAVNNAYAEHNSILNDTDEVALIPPVSGG
ncbi:MoaD/ThiS family protein [Cellulophaga lytica]|uniref:MoaD/ThiS family protein n=1 Tax=Cellulophaga TaxID=104264 RepID=UPI0009509098|nr:MULTISPECIES: MoaD/ThiS family protein [Cellulophaga]APU11497.1 molybdopterin synthase sulfur carrier subunit [Cellulophaga lytica]TVZ10068.1 molybdopterin synthase sulfur carrier subunit [Cellulophaga sp. RHA_52]SNQ44641.1 ThiamineS protein [Cellulophaga lytica]